MEPLARFQISLHSTNSTTVIVDCTARSKRQVKLQYEYLLCNYGTYTKTSLIFKFFFAFVLSVLRGICVATTKYEYKRFKKGTDIVFGDSMNTHFFGV